MERQRDIPSYVTTSSSSSKNKNRSTSWCIKVSVAFLFIGISCLSLVLKTSTLFTPQEPKETKMSGGGRDWNINDDGTISSKHMNDLVLGRGFEPLTLVEKGSDRQLVFDDDIITDLKKGESYVVLKLKSHPGRGIGKRSEVEQLDGSLRYEESAIVSESEAIRVRYEDSKFLKLANENLVFDYSPLKSVMRRTVNFVGGTNEFFPTKVSGGRRDWIINYDGTIAPKLYPDVVLGTAPAPLVLVPRGSSSQCILEHASLLKAGKIVNTTLLSHPGSAIGKMSSDEHLSSDRSWRYTESAILPSSEAIQIQYEESNYISLPEQELVFDVSYWKLTEGSVINFVGSVTRLDREIRKEDS